MRIILYSVLLYLVVGSLPLSAQTIVANINQSNDGSNPQSLQADGRYAVFTVFEGESVQRLYFVDGPDGVPEILVDGMTQAAVLNPYGVKLIDGVVYYYTHAEQTTTYSRADLAAGTITELATLASPGANGGDPLFTRVGSRILFLHVNESYIQDLYAVDEIGGTVTLLTTLSGNFELEDLLSLGDRAYLVFRYSPSEPLRYGITDGTPEGTFIRFLDDGTVYLEAPVAYGTSAVATAQKPTEVTPYLFNDTLNEWAPLRERVATLPPGRLAHFVTKDEYVFFIRSQADFTTELWRINAATDTAGLVVDLNPALDSVNVAQLQAFGDLLFYRLYDRTSGEASLYRTDGTPEGTYLLLGGISSRSVNGFSLGEVVPTDEAYYFLADRPASGTELWRTDGTPAGTFQVRDLYPGSDDPEIGQLTALGADLLFVGTAPEYGREVFRSDGTAVGTRVLADLNTAESGSVPNRFFTVNDTLFFSARTECTGFELFKTGGTANSTSLVRDLTPGRQDGSFSPAVVLGDRFYFGIGANFPAADTLYGSDGTAAGTQSAGFSQATGGGSVSLSGPGRLGERLIVLGFFSGVGQALYSFDPDSGESTVLRIFSGGGANSLGKTFTPFQDSLLLFVVASEEFGVELWRTNGTPAGTFMVKDIRQLVESTTYYHINYLEVIGGLAYFSADNGFGSQPYRSDGTEEGTYALEGEGNLNAPRNFTAYAGRVYFTAGSAGSGRIYSTTGARGDVTASPISGGTDFTFIDDLIVLGEKLIFSASTIAQGSELWAAATADSPAVLLGDLYTGPENSYPRSLFLADSTTLLFSADVPELGRELWSTDGTPEGTLLVADIHPGTASGNPENFYAYGAFTYFAADDGVTGSELWKYSPDDLDNDGYVGADDADETDPLVNAGTNGDPNGVGLVCSAPGDPTTGTVTLADVSMEVYPNPATDVLHLRLSEGRSLHLTLITSDGRLVHAGNPTAPDYTLPVGHLPGGNYLLQLRDASGGQEVGHRWVTIIR